MKSHPAGCGRNTALTFACLLEGAPASKLCGMSEMDDGESLAELGPQPFVFSDDDDETGLTPAIPAATLVVFHERGSGPPDILMVRRSARMAFAAGAAVFPGGRVDDDDFRLAARVGDGNQDPSDLAARIAAIRETLEETGLGVGIATGGNISAFAAMREGLMAEAPFSELLDQHGASLDLGGLAAFTRWRPNFAHSRVFDTRFYIARAEGRPDDLTVHHGENSELFWLSAQEALARADTGEMAIIFPTRRNLERLAQYDSFDAALESTRHFAPRRITPYVDLIDGQRHLCIRGDCGYPVTSEPMDSALRG
jgi:8-oxo-dGTP pyrophosphatase MutT (NUDIX family)